MKKIDNIIIEESYFLELKNKDENLGKLIHYILGLHFEGSDLIRNGYANKEYRMDFLNETADVVIANYNGKPYDVYNYSAGKAQYNFELKNIAAITKQNFVYEPLAVFYLVHSEKKEIPLFTQDGKDVFLISAEKLI